jgi:hypothetical protein
MIATRIISAENEIYNGRLIIKFDRHRIVLPNNNSKRMYLGKRRYRELMNSAVSKDIPLRYTDEYLYHLPKKLKESIVFDEPVKVQPVKTQVVTEEPIKQKRFFRSLFGL